jgi:hypothetical protein
MGRPVNLAFLELLHRLNAGQAIPNGYEALGGPAGDQFRQFLLAREAVKWGCGCGGGLLCGAKGCDVVLFVDSESRHNRSPCATLCAVTTFIAQVRHTSKRILKRIVEGEGIAMASGVFTKLQMYADGSR